ncbi:MAG: hypothetical protein SXQ77_13930 [Halobacteria archaeon]|nr:hypothetical protein [Halobacteria archaeon]
MTTTSTLEDRIQGVSKAVAGVISLLVAVTVIAFLETFTVDTLAILLLFVVPGLIALESGYRDIKG